jgi:hypothetical protein
MPSDPRRSSRSKLCSIQIAILAVLGVITLLAWGVFILLISHANDPTEASAVIGTSAIQLLTPTRIPADQLPKHSVPSVMNDPFDSLPENRNYERPWLQIVVNDWRNFTESDARLLSTYYLEQYPLAEFLAIDFLCDYSYTSEQEFVNVQDRFYNPHVLFRFWKKAYEWDDRTKSGITRYNRLLTRKDYPDFGTECK